MRVPSFLPKSLWGATAMESIVDVVTPITTKSSNRFNIDKKQIDSKED